MKVKMLAALLALGVSGQAAAQDPLVNLGQATGNLVPNLTSTVNSLLVLDVTATTLTLNQTVTDLHMDLTQGTPLATDSALNDQLMTLVTPHTRLIDQILAGEVGLGDLVSDLQMLSTLDPGLVLILTRGLLGSEGPLQNPDILATIVLSLLPIEGLQGGLPSGGGLLSGAGGLSLAGAGSGGLSADALPLPLDALDTGTLTALLSGTSLPGL